MPRISRPILEDLTIAIPSMGRATKQVTIKRLPASIRARVRLAIPSKEQGEYARAGWEKYLWPIPDSIRGIGKTDEYLFKRCETKALLILDDDLRFYRRIDVENSPSLVTLQPGDPKDEASMVELFLFWRKLLDTYAHVGLSVRQGNNTINTPFKECQRMFNAIMYNLPRVREVKPIFGRMEVMEDFDLTLQLLRAGLKSASIYKWCQGQGESNQPGGCSQYRTNEVQERSAKRLAQFHPGFVRVVLKHAKAGWKGGLETRTDVVISWKKAYESSNK